MIDAFLSSGEREERGRGENKDGKHNDWKSIAQYSK